MPSDWPGRFQPIPWVYAEIVRQLSCVEQVHILVQNADAEKRARGVLKRAQVERVQRALPPVADKPRLDAGFGPDFREG